MPRLSLLILVSVALLAACHASPTAPLPQCHLKPSCVAQTDSGFFPPPSPPLVDSTGKKP